MQEKYVIGLFGLIVRRGKILVLRRRPDDTFGNMWDFPGGALEWNEKPQEALKREIKEESGLSPRVLYPFDVYHSMSMEKKGARFLGISYLCKSEKGKVRLSEEHTEYTWMDPRDFKKFSREMAGGVLKAMKEYLNHQMLLIGLSGS